VAFAELEISTFQTIFATMLNWSTKSRRCCAKCLILKECWVIFTLCLKTRSEKIIRKTGLESSSSWVCQYWRVHPHEYVNIHLM